MSDLSRSQQSHGVSRRTSTLFGDGAAVGIELEALKIVLWRRTLDLAAGRVARRLNVDDGDRPGPWVPRDGCGGSAAYAGWRCEEVTTVLGGLLHVSTGSILHDLAGVNVDAKQAERTAEVLDREIAADEPRYGPYQRTGAPGGNRRPRYAVPTLGCGPL